MKGERGGGSDTDGIVTFVGHYVQMYLIAKVWIGTFTG